MSECRTNLTIILFSTNWVGTQLVNKERNIRSTIQYVALNLKSFVDSGSSTLIMYMMFVLVNIGATGCFPQITPSFWCSSSTWKFYSRWQVGVNMCIPSVTTSIVWNKFLNVYRYMYLISMKPQSFCPPFKVSSEVVTPPRELSKLTDTRLVPLDLC